MVRLTMLLLFWTHAVLSFLRPSRGGRAHNSCRTCAHQLLCERTTADVRLTNLTLRKT